MARRPPAQANSKARHTPVDGTGRSQPGPDPDGGAAERNEIADVHADYGRQFLLRDRVDGRTWRAVTRARRGDCVVGDHVRITRLAGDQAVIEEVLPRSNQVTRSDGYRSKTIAANVDLAAIVVSGHPMFDEALLLRILLALESEDIPALLIVTKQDLDASRTAVAERRAVYESLGYPVVATAALSQPESLEALSAQLAGRRTLLLGQSGMGKSTLINALVPGASQQTAIISEALSSGRHTTTFTRAFMLPDAGWLIDSPGFQSFEVAHLSRWQALHAMPEFRPLLGQCRFNDCSHIDEPSCAIRDAVDDGRIDNLRYRLFTGLRNL